MTRSAPTQRSFASGEISPLLYGRDDYIRNQTGLRTARGFLPLLEGGLTRAPGTWFRGETKGNQTPRLIPFQFAVDDALILEFTPLAMRVWRYGELVQKDGAPYELETPYDADAVARLTYVQSADVIYIADGARPIQKLSRYALDNWTLSAAEFENGPFRVQNLDEDITITANLLDADADIPAWQPDKTKSSGYQARSFGKVYTLSGTGETGGIAPTHSAGAWTQTYTTTTGGTGGSDGDPAVTTTHTITWTYVRDSLVYGEFSEVTLTASADVFDASHVGTLFMLKPQDYEDIPLWTSNTDVSLGDFMRNGEYIYELVTGSNTGVQPPIHTEGTVLCDKNENARWKYISDGTGVVKITAVTDARNATATVTRSLPPSILGYETYRWSEGAWSDLRGYPSCVEIYDQRLVAAASESEPRTIWFSTVGGYSDFQPGTDADEAFSYTISGQSSMNKIIGLRGGKRGLHIFAIGQEFSTRSDTSGQVIGPTTTVIGLDSSYGSSGATPISPDGDPIIISRDGRRVVQISYSFQNDSNSATDLSRAASHFGEETFVQLAWQGSPQRLAWIVLASGDPVVMLHNPAEEVLGWARVPLADGTVESIAVTPAGEGGLDTVTMAVRREINGESKCYIEDVANVYSVSPLAEFYNINHLYSSYMIDVASEATEFSIPHLAGDEVYAWTDGGEYGPLTVAEDGSVTLPAAASKGVIGLFDQTHYAETLDIPIASAEGDMTGRKRRIMARIGAIISRTAQGYIRAVERDLPAAARIGGKFPIVPVTVSSDLTTIHEGSVSLDVSSGMAMETSLRIEPHGGAPLTIIKLTSTAQEAGR